MALKAVVDNLDSVPESLQEHYIKGDNGKFFLNAEGIDDLPAVQGLKTKRDELLGTTRDLKDRLDKFKDVDPVKYAEALAELETIKAKDKGGKADDDAITALKEEHQAELDSVRSKAKTETEAAKGEATKDSAAARRYFLSGVINETVRAAKGEPALLEATIRDRVKVERTDGGDFKVTVLDTAGHARIKDSAGNPFTMTDLVEELRADDTYSRAFDGFGNTGSGSGGAGTGGGGGGGGGTVKWINRTEIGQHLKGVADGSVKVRPD